MGKGTRVYSKVSSLQVYKHYRAMVCSIIYLHPFTRSPSEIFKHNMTQLLPPSIYRATCVAGLENSDFLKLCFCEWIVRIEL